MNRNEEMRGLKSQRWRGITLRAVAIVGVLLAGWPAGQASAEFFPLVRRAIQLDMLPELPGAYLTFDSCGVLRLNQLPAYCERAYSLLAPNPGAMKNYPDQIGGMGWEVIYHTSAQGYDWYARRTMQLECYVFRTWVWGVNETIALAILDQQSLRVLGGGNINYCNRISRNL